MHDFKFYLLLISTKLRNNPHLLKIQVMSNSNKIMEIDGIDSQVIIISSYKGLLKIEPWALWSKLVEIMYKWRWGNITQIWVVNDSL